MRHSRGSPGRESLGQPRQAVRGHHRQHQRLRPRLPAGRRPAESYRPLGPVVEDRDAFKPISGFRVRPGLLWVPKELPPEPEAPRQGRWNTA
jgi:hypothetical protein